MALSSSFFINGWNMIAIADMKEPTPTIINEMAKSLAESVTGI